MKYLAKCDKCGKVERMIIIYDGQHLPHSWRNTEVGDLCKECLKNYEKHKEKFMKKDN